jgi:hypothetical protein
LAIHPLMSIKYEQVFGALQVRLEIVLRSLVFPMI